MSLPKFLICENKTELLHGPIILCTDWPYFTATIIKGQKLENNFHNAKITGYDIRIALLEPLEHKAFYSKAVQGLQEYRKSITREIADFYYEEKIKRSPKVYARYLE